MPATLRLMRLGKKRQPHYRVIVIDKRKKRDTRYIENVGTYEPLSENGDLKLKKERFEYWVAQGALISEGLSKLLKNKKRIKYEA